MVYGWQFRSQLLYHKCLGKGLDNVSVYTLVQVNSQNLQDILVGIQNMDLHVARVHIHRLRLHLSRDI